MNKKYLLFLAVPVLAIALGSSAYAFYGNPREGQVDIISAIAKKFNLNSADVQKVFDEQRIVNQTQKEQKFTDLINKAVTDGKLTQDQANKIIAKHAEIKAQRDALQGKTNEEINSAMKIQRDALKQWAIDNNIPTQYLMFAMQNGKGPGMFGQGKGQGCLNR
jgi:polyhydroxyalkanoate synthesis regulator phasin